ncbi:MAG: site-2 protease family protein [Firmicutes bacterium]|nr:site-2 protease family protein [Dethiobacter sp.]MBS3889343.1 site-2 protease family protein [Bacillota bacterium]MBS4055327.1 site-2 protease family protein [Thermaerobacter sp.]
MDLLALLPENLIFLLPALLLALTVHEFAHAYVSHRLGDPTPKWQGRLTLNPIAHIDPVGFLMIMFFRFGWGKAVEIDPKYYRNRRQGMVLVSVAGPAANIVTAFVLVVAHILVMILNPAQMGGFVGELLSTAISLNIFLAVFNLLPIPPLDGSKILAGLLPGKYSYRFQSFTNQWGMLLLLVVVMTGITSYTVLPIGGFLLDMMYGVVLAFVGIFV